MNAYGVYVVMTPFQLLKVVDGGAVVVLCAESGGDGGSSH